jgi:hypothetical protein
VINAQSDILIRRNIQATISITVFVEEVVPSSETSTSLISANGRVFLEGLGVVWVIKDYTSISKNALRHNFVILVVLVGCAILPNVVKGSILVFIISCFHIGWEL